MSSFRSLDSRLVFVLVTKKFISLTKAQINVSSNGGKVTFHVYTITHTVAITLNCSWTAGNLAMRVICHDNITTTTTSGVAILQ